MHSRAMVDSESRVRRLMSCLGDPSRFELVRRLLRGERCVSDLAQDVGLSQSCTTRHLQVLQREQMVVSERRGKRVMFRLCMDEPQASTLLAWAMSARAGGRAANPGRRDRKRRPAAPPDVERDVRSPAPANGPARPTSREPSSAPKGTPGPSTDSTPPPRRPARSDLEDFLL